MKVQNKPKAMKTKAVCEKLSIARRPSFTDAQTSHIEIRRSGRDQAGARYREIRFMDDDIEKKIWVPLADLNPGADTFDFLNREGAHLVSMKARNELINRIQSHRSVGPETKIVSQIGLNGDIFVLPDQYFGSSKVAVEIRMPLAQSDRFERYSVGGTLEGAQKLVKFIKGNSRFTLLYVAAFSGPIAALLKREMIGLMPVGPGGTGKTTLLMAVGSVWGADPDPSVAAKYGFVRTLNATPNYLEDELLAARHSLLPLDETRGNEFFAAMPGVAIETMIFRLDGGAEKGRQNTTRKRLFASVPFIIASNPSLGEMMAAGGKATDEALHSRLISVPLPEGCDPAINGMFENLHGHENVVSLCGSIRKIIAENFGHPSRTFLKALMREHKNAPQKLLKYLEQKRKEFLVFAKQVHAPGRNLNRINEKMATLYATGRFLNQCGIFQIDRVSLRESLLVCIRDHVALVEREKTLVIATGRTRPPPSYSVTKEDLIANLRSYFVEHQDKIIDIGKVRPGYKLPESKLDWPILQSKHHENGIEYLLTEKKLRAIMGGELQASLVKRALNELGLIAVERGDSAVPRYSVKRRVPGQITRQQVIAIRAAVLEGD